MATAAGASVYWCLTVTDAISNRLFHVMQIMDDYSSRSFRLLAMAVGVIPKAAKLNLVQMTQQQIEASAVNMQLLSLVVLANNVRSDSKATITQLQDR